MTTTKASPAPKCEYCDKRGVPILPLRYAVASVGAGAPPAQGPEVAMPGSAATYTLRLLRTGYLYVFDEARKRWDDYFVTADGYFFRLHSTPGVPPVLPTKPFNCPDAGHAEVASCITIPDAKRATLAWLGFSDVQWTEAVRARHESPAYRKRHMRCVDVKSFAASVDKAHCLPIAGVGARVAEYALPADALSKAVGFSPFEPSGREGRAPRLAQECERMHPGRGFAVALDDPAGVAQELALLMKRNHDTFVAQNKHQRALAVDSVIEQLELAIKQQAERERLMQAQRDALNMTNPGYMGGGDGGGAAAAGMALARALNTKLDQRLSEVEEDIRNVPGTELDAAAAKAWRRYAEKLDAGARATWRAGFDSALKDCDARLIAPLAQVHRALMLHPSLFAYFDCNYDRNEIRSGEVYTAVLAHCITTTADKKACFDLYTDWLKGDMADTRNLLLQALAYNHAPAASAIVSAASASTDLAGLPWDKVIEAVDKATAKLTTGSPDALGRLIGMLTGPIAALLDAAKSPKVFSGLVALGVAARQPIVPVEITGSKKAFRALLIRQLMRLSGQNLDRNKIQFAVAEELRRLKMHGVPLEGTAKKRWLLMIDPAEVPTMPRGLDAAARARWLAGNIRTPEQVEALNLARFGAKLESAAGTLRGGLPVAFGVLGVVANWLALDSVRDGERKAMQHNKSEGLRRIYAQGAQTIGAVASTVEAGLAKIPALASSFARGIQSVSARALGLMGRLLGVGGSLLMAGIDLWRGYKEFQDGNLTASGLYVVSGVLGAAATWALFLGATGIGLVLVAALIVVAFAITALVDNNLQDWLERCLWGTLTRQRFASGAEELSELKAALG